MDLLTPEEKLQKGLDLNYFRHLDFYKQAQSSEIEPVFEHIFSEMRAEGKVPSQKTYADNLKENARLIIIDLLNAFFTDPQMYIAYSRNYNDYKTTPVSARNTVKVIDFLIEHEYIENHKGVYQIHRRSRMRSNRKLADLMGDRRFPIIKRVEEDEIIILRDKDKNPIDYEDTDATNQMRKNLQLINSVLEKADIKLEISEDSFIKLREDLKRDPDKEALDYSRKKLRRIFNDGSWTRGGRFYGGWWTEIPSEYRHFIEMSGFETVEIDYSAMQINILYAIKNLPIPEGDLYSIDEYPEARDFLKKSLSIILNTDSEIKAKQSIQGQIYKRKIRKPNGLKQISDVIDKFAEKHSAIKDYFFTGAGIDLMFLDSKLAERIMLSFAETNTPILPVHDSFIVNILNEDKLQETMDHAFFGLFGRRCETKAELSSSEYLQKEAEGMLIC